MASTRRRGWTPIAAAAALLVAAGCGGNPTSGVGPDGDQALTKPASLAKITRRARNLGTRLLATVTQDGEPVEGVELAFSRSISGILADYEWSGTTDADGKVQIDIIVDANTFMKRRGASGYYLARATDPDTEEIIGKWTSIPISGGKEIEITLPIGERVRIASKSAIQTDAMGLKALHHLHRNAVGAHDLPRLQSYFASDSEYDYVPLGSILAGREQIGAFFAQVFSGFPDFRTVPGFDLVLSDGDMVVAEHSTLGTHEGPFQGIPATGSVVSLPYLDIKEFRGDRLQEVRTYLDGASQLIQMGVMPAPDMPTLVPSVELADAEATGLSPLQAEEELLARWNTHDLAHWAEMIHPDADIFYSTLGVRIDRDGVVAANELFLLGFPDLQGELVRMVDMGEGWVFAEYVFGGTNDGPYFGIPATGRTSQARLAWISRYDADGLVVYLHVYFDNLSVLAQLGVLG